MDALGICGMWLAVFRGEEDLHPIALLAISLCMGVMVLKMWDSCPHVYMTREGIELTKPSRVIPWRLIGDTFRVPMSSWSSTCCIGINECGNWDLKFFGREDFEDVVAKFRAASSSTGTNLPQQTPNNRAR